MSTFADLIERVKRWPRERQEDIAHVIEAMEQGGTDVYKPSSAERRAVAVGLAQARRGEFVSDQDLEKFPQSAYMRVRFTLAAFEDIAAISQWHEPDVADRLESAILAATDRLEKQPELGVQTDDHDVRRWPMPEHRLAIFYRNIWRADQLGILCVIESRGLRDLRHAP